MAARLPGAAGGVVSGAPACCTDDVQPDRASAAMARTRTSSAWPTTTGAIRYRAVPPGTSAADHGPGPAATRHCTSCPVTKAWAAGVQVTARAGTTAPSACRLVAGVTDSAVGAGISSGLIRVVSGAGGSWAAASCTQA